MRIEDVEELDIVAVDDWPTGRQKIYVYAFSGRGVDQKMFIGRLEFDEMKEHQPVDATISISAHKLERAGKPNPFQSLSSCLWTMGYRPKESEGSIGQLAATTKHLEDMRQLAFNALATEKP